MSNIKDNRGARGLSLEGSVALSPNVACAWVDNCALIYTHTSHFFLIYCSY